MRWTATGMGPVVGLILLIWSVATSSSLARAQGPPSRDSKADKMMARKLATEGFEALDAEDYATAEDRFRRADELYEAPTLRLARAQSEVGLGRVVEAAERLREVSKMSVGVPPNPTFVEAQKTARSLLPEVEARIAYLVIELIGGDDAVRVTIDGVQVSPAALERKRPINPGAHVLEARDGSGAVSQSVRLGDGDTKTVRLRLVARRQTPVPAPDAPPWGPAYPEGGGREPASNTRLVAGAVTLGLGGAGFVVGAVTGGLALGYEADLAATCPNRQCPPEQDGTVDAFDTTSTLATIGFIAGGAFAATGVVLLLVEAFDDDDGAANVPVDASLRGLRIRF